MSGHRENFCHTLFSCKLDLYKESCSNTGRSAHVRSLRSLPQVEGNVLVSLPTTLNRREGSSSRKVAGKLLRLPLSAMHSTSRGVPRRQSVIDGRKVCQAGSKHPSRGAGILDDCQSLGSASLYSSAQSVYDWSLCHGWAGGRSRPVRGVSPCNDHHLLPKSDPYSYPGDPLIR